MNNHILFVDNTTRCFCIFRLPIAKALIENGYRVSILSPNASEEQIEQLKRDGITHINYDIKGKFSPLHDLKLLWRFIKLYGEIKPDFIVHYTIKPNIYGSIAAKIKGIQSLSVVPGTGSAFQGGGIISQIVFMLYTFAFLFPKKVWVLNQEDYDAMLSHKIVKKNKIEILPSEGVNVDYFKPQAEYEKHNPFIFLYMGRMLREKGVEYLTKAIRKIKEEGQTNVELHLLGLVDGLTKDVITMDEIKAWEDEGLVRFLGSAQDVRPYIEASDCIALPTFYGEGVPRSLMEACSMSRPILASDNVGCRDVVDNNKNGLLCQSRSVEDLADKMKQLMNMSEAELKALGENGRQKMITEFREEIIVKRYIDLINDSLNHGSKNE